MSEAPVESGVEAHGGEGGGDQYTGWGRTCQQGDRAMSTNDYDRACRYLLRAYAAAMLRWLLRLPADQMQLQGWLEPRMTEPGRDERISDTIAWLLNVKRNGVPWAVVVEFQIEPDPDMFGRLLEYLGAAYRLFRPSPEKGDRFQVGAVVVNLKGNGKSFRRVTWKEAGLDVRLKGREWNLAALDARRVLGEVEAGTAPRPVLAFVP